MAISSIASATSPIVPAALPKSGPPSLPVGKPQQEDATFSQLIGDVLRGANADQVQADTVLENLATGNGGNVHDVVLAVAQADLSFRFLLEMRNRLIESYQEVMRMQF